MSSRPDPANSSYQLHSIANKPLKERVLDALRDAILNGDFKPGQPLIETEIAAQLGVSRAPLREALQILSTEGLVETVPYHGSRVRALTRVGIEELYSLRTVLETFALERVMARRNPADVEHLREIYERMLAAAERGDLASVSAIDRDFHLALITMSGHSLLLSIWQMVAMRVQQVMALRNRRNSDFTQIARNHLPIIDAIAAGDLEQARALLIEHIASSADLIIDGWDYLETVPE